MTITKQVLNRLKCECVLVPFLVAHAHWYKGPVIMQSKRPVIMFSKSHSRVCSKLMEHIILKHLLNNLKANNILFDKQHGFRKNPCCLLPSLHTRHLGQPKRWDTN